jgi:hypothetical protein
VNGIASDETNPMVTIDEPATFPAATAPRRGARTGEAAQQQFEQMVSTQCCPNEVSASKLQHCHDRDVSTNCIRRSRRAARDTDPTQRKPPNSRCWR